MIDNCTKYCNGGKAKRGMAKHRMEWDTFGGRVKLARDGLGMTQDDMIAELKRHGVDVSGAAYSKLETGETKRIHVEYLLAISQIFNISADELLTGKVATLAQFETDEANAAGALLDAMLPRQRKLAMQLLRIVAEMDKEAHAEMDEMRDVLGLMADRLTNGQKARIDRHIERTLVGNPHPVAANP